MQTIPAMASASSSISSTDVLGMRIFQGPRRLRNASIINNNYRHGPMEMVLRYEYAPAVFDGEFDHTEVQNKYCPSCRDIANPRLFLRACTQPQRGWMVHHPPPNSEIICLPPHLRMAAKDEPRDG